MDPYAGADAPLKWTACLWFMSGSRSAYGPCTRRPLADSSGVDGPLGRPALSLFSLLVAGPRPAHVSQFRIARGSIGPNWQIVSHGRVYQAPVMLGAYTMADLRSMSRSWAVHTTLTQRSLDTREMTV